MPGVGLDIWNEQPGGGMVALDSAPPARRVNEDMYTVAVPARPASAIRQLPQMAPQQLAPQQMAPQQMAPQQMAPQQMAPMRQVLQPKAVMELGTERQHVGTDVWQRHHFWIYVGLFSIVFLLLIIVLQLYYLKKAFSKK
jgi:hypothetical protein